jgi:plastocyanin
MHLSRAWAALPLSLALIAAAVPTANAQTPPQNATVSISDSGFSPASLTVPVGATITWTNQGTGVHTATSTPAQTSTGKISTPAPFDSGGLGPGQNFSISLGTPGTYIYTSAPDCLNGNVTPNFTCTGYSITVGAPSGPAGAAPAASASASPGIGPAPAPAGTTVMQSAIVAISDTGFSPAVVAVATGGTPSTGASVTFVNQGTQLHTAVSGQVHMDESRSAPEIFDTGGLAPGDSKTFNFVNTGTYKFNSAPDCLNGANNPAFNCAGPYTIQVVRAPVGADVSAVAPPFSGAVVYFRDPNGFDPGTITVKAGQVVTWLNLGHSTHSVVSDPGANPSFDSGGLGIGSTFSVTFSTPGTYHYHSSTDPVFSGNQVASYQYSATIVVEP